MKIAILFTLTKNYNTMETSFNKICKSIASIRTESQCESIEAMIRTFKDKYKREGHEYSYILVGALLMAKQIKFN